MITVDTAHYHVRTDVSKQFAALVGQHMEAIFQQYSRQFSDYGQVRDKFNVVVFRHEADYTELTHGTVHGSCGVFIPDMHMLAAFTEGRTTEDVLRTLYHEGFHQFMFTVVSPEAPVWVERGDRRVLLQRDVERPRLHPRRGARRSALRHPAGRQERHLRPVPPPLRDVGRAVDQEQRRRLEAGGPAQYSEAWSIVHYLIHADGGRHAQMLNRLLKEVAGGQVPSSAMEDVFGNNYNRFEDAWARYVMTLKPSPKFRCRDNMETLLLVAQFIYKDPRG